VAAHFDLRTKIVNPFGLVMEGRDDVRETMAAQLQGPMQGSTHDLTVTEVRFVTDDVAVLDGEVAVSTGDGRSGTSHTTWVLRLEHGRWLIHDMRGYYRTDNLPERGAEAPT